MIADTFLALIPTYGPWLIFASVTLSGLALPVPSSLMVMVAGGVVAAGDLGFWQLVLVACAGGIVGDQIVFWLARRSSGPVLDRFAKGTRAVAFVERASSLVKRRGLLAVFLSRTVLSPLGPYVGYISGTLGMNWFNFTVVNLVGGVLWCIAYAWLGFTFTELIYQIASLVSKTVGTILVGFVVCSAFVLSQSLVRRAGAEAERIL